MREFAKDLGVVLFEKQFKAMKLFMEDKDMFVALPTGYGKSMIYAMPPICIRQAKRYSATKLVVVMLCIRFAGCSGSIIVCVSSLTAIMIDQKSKVHSKRLVTELVGETQDVGTEKEVIT